MTIGADLRTLAVYGDERKEENNFFQMQGDVYLHFQLDRRFSAYFDRGTSGSYELFGTGYVLPANGYFKAGRFTPAYGWRFADHTMFTRREIGYFDPPAHSDVGLELGFFPGDGSLNFSVMNGAPGLVRDMDGVRAYVARAEIRRRLGPLNIGVGASGLAVDEEEREPWAAGPFGYASWGPWTWVGEWDWKREAGPAGATAFVTSHEFTRQIVRGVDLRATYDFYDPDRDRETGARTRAGIGIDTLPYPYLGVLAMLNYHDYDEGIDVTGDDRVQANLVLHFLYDEETRHAPHDHLRPPHRGRRSASIRVAFADRYVIAPGKGTEVVFRSEAPLESFEGKTDQARGTVSIDWSDPAGTVEIRIAVDLAHLDTGIDLRNRHMRENHLHTDEYPEAIFTARTIEGLPAGNTRPAAAVECVLTGDFTLHGVTKEMTVPVTIAPHEGNALAIEARFDVTLSDHEISRPKFLFLKLDETQHVRVRLVATPEAKKQ